MLDNSLGNQQLMVRFMSLYVVGLVLFFAAWTVSYWMLPEGLITGFGPLNMLAGDTAADTLLSEFLTIFGVNLLGLLLVVVANYVLRVRNIGFGYLIPLAWMIIYGVTLGTNSFSIPLDEPMAPTLTVFSRSGLYEMMAATLLAAATNSISVNRSETFRSSSERVPKAERRPLTTGEWVAVGGSVLMLAAAALREAYMIMRLV
ncbi:MAG: hypothetical protein R6U25_10920 [Alkalispirochaeta sp.]